jgi:hypothetical protein
LVVSDFEPYSTAMKLNGFEDWTLEEMAERLQVLEAFTSPDLACRDTMRFLRARIRQEETSLSDQDQIKAIAQERGIETLVHFTFVENLDSILKYGVMPIVELQRQGRPHAKFDHSRADNEYDKTSFSVEFPNYYMLARRLNKPPMPTWIHDLAYPLVDGKPNFAITKSDDTHKVLTPNKQRFCILGFKASLAWERPCRFFNGNAACNCVYKSNSAASRVLVFKEFFAPVVKYNYEEWSRQADLPSALPTQSQAEIMIPGVIPIRYIKWVAFQDQQTKDEVLGKIDCPDKISVTVKPQLFAGRCDWQSQYPSYGSC